MDASDVTLDSAAQLQDALKTQAMELPRLLNQHETTAREQLAKLPTLPTLASLSLLAFLMNPDEYREPESKHPALLVEWPTRISLELPKPNEPHEISEPSEILEFGRDFSTFVKAVEQLFDTYRHTISSDFVRRGTPSTAMDSMRAAAKSTSAFVRNSLYEFQLSARLEALFHPFDNELRASVGFAVSDLLNFDEQAGELVNERIQAIVRANQSEQPELAKSLNIDESDKKAIHKLRALANIFMYARQSSSIFMFMPDDFSNPTIARSILEHFSNAFGIPDSGRFSAPADIQVTPFIRIAENQYFCHLLPVWLQQARTSLEAILKEVDGAWARYDAHRADYVENSTANYLAEAMPRADVKTKLTYQGADYNGELDVMVTIDRTIFLAECKANALGQEERRAPKLRGSLRSITKKGHEQALRALAHIRDGDGRFQCGGTSITIDVSDYDRIYLVVVSLDDISAFMTQTATALQAGFLSDEGEIPWAVSLGDLELICDMCESNAVLPLFLERRLRVAQSSEYSTIEELDWWMHFLERGLYFSKSDAGDLQKTHILSFTVPMDDYYLYAHGPRTKAAPKPSMQISPTTKQLINAIESIDDSGWLEGAILIAGLSIESQRAIRERLKALRRHRRSTLRVESLEFSAGQMVVMLSARASGRVPTNSIARYAKSRMVLQKSVFAVAIFVDPSSSIKGTHFSIIDARRTQMPSQIEARELLPENHPLNLASDSIQR